MQNMTMVIDKNSELYTNFLKIKEIFKNTSDKDHKKICAIVDSEINSLKDCTPSFVLTTIEGIELQVEYFINKTGFVFYAVFDENGKVIINKQVLQAKEVEDD
jgi:hypothetical protein